MTKPKYWTKKYKVAFVVGGFITFPLAYFNGLGLLLSLLAFVIGGFACLFLVAVETLDEPPTGYH